MHDLNHKITTNYGSIVKNLPSDQLRKQFKHAVAMIDIDGIVELVRQLPDDVREQLKLTETHLKCEVCPV